MTTDEIEAFGYKLRLKFKDERIKDNTSLVQLILKETGGKISKNEDDFIGLYIESESSYRIKLDPYASPIRDNFMIMRNIGHVLLHSKKDKIGFFLDVIGTKDFVEGNIFASAVLLPKNELIALKGKKNIAEIAAIYQVPTDYVAARLKVVWKDANINMKRYRSTEEVYAVAKKFDKEIKSNLPKSTAQIGEEGYKVVYKNGYITWLPKEVFEERYIEILEQ